MRTKKALLNSSINIIGFIIAFIPNIIIRKIFLETLGSELLGLNSLYTNIIGWLSIAELGIGTVIVFSLYKPYAINDKKLVRAYIRFYKSFYRTTGIIVLGIGLCLTPFLKFFIGSNIDLKLVSLGFVLFLMNSFISYIFSSRICILNVAQEAYKVTIATTISKLLTVILQVCMLKIYPSFLVFISIQLIINLMYFILINAYILKKYPWLNDGKDNLEKEEKKSLLKNVRAMFMHKIASLVVNSTDNIVISKFIGLGTLAIYTNYQIIIAALQSIVSTALGGLTASIGNLLTTGDKDKAYDIHRKIFFMNFWAVSFIVISLYNTLNQFIGLWVGDKYLLDELTYVIILINTYFASMRGSVEQFQSGSGMFYQDRYAPICEAIINLVTSLILVKHIGIAGVFIGTLVSNFTVIFWTKPYVVYRYVFDKKLIHYYKMYFKYLLIAVIPLVVTSYITKQLKTNYTIISFIFNCLLNITIINIIYCVIFYRSNEFKYYLTLIKNILKRTKGNLNKEVNVIN